MGSAWGPGALVCGMAVTARGTDRRTTGCSNFSGVQVEVVLSAYSIQERRSRGDTEVGIFL